MKILLDRCLPRRFAHELSDAHEAVHACMLPWGAESNGTLVRMASQEGYEVLLTVDKKMPSQTSLEGLSVGGLVVDVPDNTLETMLLAAEDIRNALPRVRPGEYPYHQGRGLAIAGFLNESRPNSDIPERHPVAVILK